MIFRLGTVKSSNNQIYYYKQISNGINLTEYIKRCDLQKQVTPTV